MVRQIGTGALTTFVFADIEGSTTVFDRLGDDVGVPSVVRQLDELAERVDGYGGRIVKSTGDGMLVTFESPRQAVSFALAAQRALVGSAPRVKIGMNTGEADWQNADPLGAAVNAAARIAARADGGEVLVTDVVRLLTSAVPAFHFRDRGRHRLRGFSERWHLWMVEDRASARHTVTTIGRTDELATIDELVSSTAIGAGRVLLLEGEAGIGKTHLAREAAARAADRGVIVVEVTADELVRRPGALAHSLLAAAGGRATARERLAQALTPERGDRIDHSFAVVEASIDLVEDLARDRPVIVIAEDLHWGDDLSTAIFAAVARRCPVSRFSVMGTTRPSGRSPSVDRVLEACRDGLGQHLRLGPLNPVDVQALASAITAAAPGASLRTRLDATGGNPLYVRELLHCLDDDGALRIDDGVAEVADDVPLAGLHDTLVRRLSWLPAETNEVLRYASLLGTAFTLQDVGTVMGRSVVDVAGWLREASLAGLITGDGDRMSFRHDLIREAVYGHMLAAERRDLHRAAGDALAAAGSSARQVAEQFGRGGRVGDRQAIRWLERGADEVLPVSPAGAVELLEQAISLTPEHWPERLELQARCLEPLVLCGRFDEAESLGEAVFAGAPTPATRFAALRAVSAAHGNRGDLALAVRSLRRAADIDGAPADEVQQTRCFIAALATPLGGVTVDEARKVAEETLAMAGEIASLQCAGHQGLGWVQHISGRQRDAQVHLATAAALVSSGHVRPWPYIAPSAVLAWTLNELDDLEAAASEATDALRRAGRAGNVALLPMSYMAIATACRCAGRWDDALAEIDAMTALCREIGSPSWLLAGEAMHADISLHRGDQTTATHHVANGLEQLAQMKAQLGADMLLEVQARLLQTQGDVDGALALITLVWAKTANIRYFLGHRERGSLAVRLAVLGGHLDFAREVTADLEEGARRTPVASAIGAAQRCRGLVARNGDLMLEAVASYRTTPRRPELAACCEDAATVLAEARRRDEAIALLHEAAGIHADLGATGDAARVDDGLRGLGVRRARVREARPTFGWASLTPTELGVTRLVADGLTNPEIGARLYISRRTVETHLSHVFRKLDLANRTQLVAELSRRTPIR